MGEFDFTYVLPKNFSRRVVQYLEQLESPNVAKAFQNCTYDYEDLGLAYYVGMKGDNWDKKALLMCFMAVIRYLHTKWERAKHLKWRPPQWKPNGWGCVRKAFLSFPTI